MPDIGKSESPQPFRGSLKDGPFVSLEKMPNPHVEDTSDGIAPLPKENTPQPEKKKELPKPSLWKEMRINYRTFWRELDKKLYKNKKTRWLAKERRPAELWIDADALGSQWNKKQEMYAQMADELAKEKLLEDRARFIRNRSSQAAFSVHQYLHNTENTDAGWKAILDKMKEKEEDGGKQMGFFDCLRVLYGPEIMKPAVDLTYAEMQVDRAELLSQAFKKRMDALLGWEIYGKHEDMNHMFSTLTNGASIAKHRLGDQAQRLFEDRFKAGMLNEISGFLGFLGKDIELETTHPKYLEEKLNAYTESLALFFARDNTPDKLIKAYEEPAMRFVLHMAKEIFKKNRSEMLEENVGWISAQEDKRAHFLIYTQDLEDFFSVLQETGIVHRMIDPYVNEILKKTNDVNAESTEQEQHKIKGALTRENLEYIAQRYLEFWAKNLNDKLYQHFPPRPVPKEWVDEYTDKIMADAIPKIVQDFFNKEDVEGISYEIRRIVRGTLEGFVVDAQDAPPPGKRANGEMATRDTKEYKLKRLAYMLDRVERYCAVDPVFKLMMCGPILEVDQIRKIILSLIKTPAQMEGDWREVILNNLPKTDLGEITLLDMHFPKL